MPMDSLSFSDENNTKCYVNRTIFNEANFFNYGPNYVVLGPISSERAPKKIQKSKTRATLLCMYVCIQYIGRLFSLYDLLPAELLASLEPSADSVNSF